MELSSLMELIIQIKQPPVNSDIKNNKFEFRKNYLIYSNSPVKKKTAIIKVFCNFLRAFAVPSPF